MTGKFELTMKILEGSIQCPTSAAHTLHHTFYVETTVDGVRHEEDNTELVKQVGGKVAWNKQITKTFRTLEPATPIMVSLTVYQKKKFLSGFNIVGTAHFALADLIRIINKPAVTGKMALNTSKRNLMSGHILVELQMRSNDAPVAAKNEKASPRAVSAIFSPIPNSDSLNNCTDVEAVPHDKVSQRPTTPTKVATPPRGISPVPDINPSSLVSAITTRVLEQKRESLLMTVFVLVMVAALVVCTTVQVLG